MLHLWFNVFFSFFHIVYSLNGSRLSNGVVPRDDRDCGSTLPLRGVCMPDGVLDPLRFRLQMGKKFQEKKMKIRNSIKKKSLLVFSSILSISRRMKDKN